MTTLRKDPRQHLHEVAVALNRAKSADNEFPISSVELSASTLHVLARLIYRVSQGEDARKVFQQAKRYQAKLETAGRHREFAQRYFELQVMHRKSEAEAAALVAIECGLKPSSVSKTMRPYREDALRWLAGRHMFSVLRADGSKVTDAATLDALQADDEDRVAEFRKKTEPYAKRGNDRSKVGKKRS